MPSDECRAQLRQGGHQLRFEKPFGTQLLDEEAPGCIVLAGIFARLLPLLLGMDSLLTLHGPEYGPRVVSKLGILVVIKVAADLGLKGSSSLM